MFVNFKTDASPENMNQILSKWDGVNIYYNKEKDLYCPSVKKGNSDVVNAISCWLQLQLKEMGYSVEGVQTTTVISYSWGKNQDEMLCSSDPVLEEPKDLDDAEIKVQKSFEKYIVWKAEEDKRQKEWKKYQEEKARKEEERKQKAINAQRELAGEALQSVKYRKSEESGVNDDWYFCHLGHWLDSPQGKEFCKPQEKGTRFTKFTNGRYIVCQSKINDDYYFVKINKDIYIVGTKGLYGCYVVSKDKQIDYSEKLGETIYKGTVSTIKEQITRYDTLGLLMNVGSFCGDLTGNFWGMKLTLTGDLENQWDVPKYRK